jgi:hypothetical protein
MAADLGTHGRQTWSLDDLHGKDEFDHGLAGRGALEDTLDLLSTPGAMDEIRAAEAAIARGEAIGADELRRQMALRTRAERGGE